LNIVRVTTRDLWNGSADTLFLFVSSVSHGHKTLYVVVPKKEKKTWLWEEKKKLCYFAKAGFVLTSYVLK